MWQLLRAVPLLAIALAACGDGATTGTTEFDGVLAGDNESGTFTITIEAAVSSIIRGSDDWPAVSTSVAGPMGPAASVNVTGSLAVKGGSNASLTGTYNTESKALSATGGGYTLNGTYAGGRLNGTYSGPSGNGVMTGFRRGGGGVQRYCGTFSGDAAGVWNLARSDNDLSGAFHETDGTGAGTLTGSLSGSNVSLSFTGGTATGTLSGTAMSGSWSTLDGDQGSWTGSTGGC
jgi:hypothetical protein